MFSSMMISVLALFIVGSVAQSSSSSASGPAQTIVVNVSNNATTNATTVFSPAQITASVGDLVLFNFTEGNHTATQSSFFAPCEPVNFTANQNGFDSNFVVVPENFTGVRPILAVPILVQNDNETMWFYDANTCSGGGVGVINLVAGDPATSGQTLDGFRRNAMRLNGTSTTSTSSSHSSTGTSQASSTSTSQSNAAQGTGLDVLTINLGFGLIVTLGVATMVPLFVL